MFHSLFRKKEAAHAGIKRIMVATVAQGTEVHSARVRSGVYKAVFRRAYMCSFLGLGEQSLHNEMAAETMSENTPIIMCLNPGH